MTRSTKVRRTLAAVALGVASIALLASPAQAGWGCGDPGVILGTPGKDTITGTAGVDYICGLGGRDHIYGLGAGDYIDGGDGNDTIYPGGGDDQVNGNLGRDTVSYQGVTADVTVQLAFPGSAIGAGVDSVNGFENAVTGSGNDSLSGDFTDNNLHGGVGNDTFFGGAGADKAWGGPGDDHFDLLDQTNLDWANGNGGANTCDIDDVSEVTINCTDSVGPPP